MKSSGEQKNCHGAMVWGPGLGSPTAEVLYRTSVGRGPGLGSGCCVAGDAMSVHSAMVEPGVAESNGSLN